MRRLAGMLNENDQRFVMHLLGIANLAKLNDNKASKYLRKKDYPQSVISAYLAARQAVRQKLLERRRKHAEVPTSEREGAGAPRRVGPNREEPQRLAGSDAGSTAEP